MVATAQLALRSPALATALLVLAACASGSALAGSMMDNPVTQQSEVTVVLSHYHPAYGAITPAAAEAYVIPTHNGATKIPSPANSSPNESPKQSAEFDPRQYGTVKASTSRRRELEASSTDIERLEAYFGTKMERNVDKLAQYASGAFTPAPWPSSYWPVYADGINHRWAGADAPSPSEKYATAFGLDTKTFTDAISRNNGITSQNYRQACTKTEECAFLNDGSICGIRRGESKGFCIPGWFGICHAWAPAAILEKEPKCAVKKGSTTFQPFDIKALMTQVYDGARVRTVFTGSRFDGPDTPENKDSYGRFIDARRRDLGPGFFHIAVTNILGRFNKSFVVDVTAGAQVWNQPVRDYEVLEVTRLTLKEGAQTYFNTDTYPFNAAAVSLAYVRTNVRWIIEAVEDGELVSTGRVDAYSTTGDYTYLLELDAQSNIIGGEWVADSRSNHPDFLWIPIGRPDASVVTEVGLSYQHVLELLDASFKCADLDATPAPTPAPTTAPTTAPTLTPAPSSDTCATPAWGHCGNQNTLSCCPSGQYCQAWDAWNYQCLDIPMTCPQQFTNIDFYGNDITARFNLSPADCCEACAATAGCKAYTFVNENSDGVTVCYLKSSSEGQRLSVGAVSGILA